MGSIFGWILTGVLALMLIGEVGRYTIARRDSAGLPYPRERFSRRLAIGSLLLSVAVLGNFWPRTSAALQLALLAYCCLAVMLALVLAARDLTETSRAAVAYARRIELEAGAELRDWLDNRQGNPEAPPGAPSDASADDPVPKPAANEAAGTSETRPN